MSRAKSNASLSSLIQASPGSLVTSDEDSLENLPPGEDGYFLQADSAEPRGIRWAASSGAGTVTSVGISTASLGMSVSGEVTSAGDLIVNLDGDLNAISQLSGSGYAKRTGADTWITSSTVSGSEISGNITGTSSGITGVTLGNSATRNVGQVASTVATGDDSRFLSTTQKTDLTDNGESTLHYHASDRDVVNATGILAIANGGTGEDNATDAFNSLTPAQAGNSGKFLTTNGSVTAWSTISGGGTGDVVGPTSSQDNTVALFDGVTGKLIKAGSSISSFAPVNNPTFTGTVAGVTKAMVGLGNADNTSDATKNAATATLTNKTISSGSSWAGTKIGPTVGGTDQTTWTKGDVLYASATNTLSKLPVGLVNQVLQVSSAGIPSWANPTSTSSVWGNGATIDRPYENYVTAGGVDGWPDRTTPENSLLRIGIGTEASPRSMVVGDSPAALFIQNYVATNFTGDDWAYSVSGIQLDTIVKGGVGGSTPFSSTSYKMPGTYTGNCNAGGGRLGVDARKATHYNGMYNGLWAYVQSDRGATAGLANGIEINVFVNKTVNTTTNYSIDPFYSNGSRVHVGLHINNHQGAVNEFGGSAGQYQNQFGIGLTSHGPGGVNGRSFGYQTGIYTSDCSKENIRIRAGVLGSAEKSDYGIRIEGNACNIAGIALGPNKFNWGTGSSAGTVSNNGDMLYNDISGVLYFNQLGATCELPIISENLAATGNTVNRKLRVKVGGVYYYLLASTSWT